MFLAIELPCCKSGSTVQVSAKRPSTSDRLCRICQCWWRINAEPIGDGQHKTVFTRIGPLHIDRESLNGQRIYFGIANHRPDFVSAAVIDGQSICSVSGRNKLNAARWLHARIAQLEVYAWTNRSGKSWAASHAAGRAALRKAVRETRTTVHQTKKD